MMGLAFLAWLTAWVVLILNLVQGDFFRAVVLFVPLYLLAAVLAAIARAVENQQFDLAYPNWWRNMK